mgnify:CR=1 FL=1
MQERFEKEIGGGRRLEREQTTIRLPAKLKEQLAQEASDRGISLNHLIIILLQKGLKHQ